jgi:hypothetical protein
MTITFRVDDGHNILLPSATVITPDQLSVLRDLLGHNVVCSGVAMVVPIHWDSAVITVVNEAQFLGCRARIWQAEPSGDLKLGLGLNPDAAPELEVANGNAYAILASLGLDEESCGAVPMSELRERLMDLRIRRRLDDDPHVTRYVEARTTMAALKPVDGEYHLAWA